MTHLLSIMVLLLKVHATRSCRGISQSEAALGIRKHGGCASALNKLNLDLNCTRAYESWDALAASAGLCEGL